MLKIDTPVITRLRQEAMANIAANPDMKSYHAAAVCQGRKIICTGVNQPRSYLNGKVCMSIHAEQAAIYSMYRRVLSHRGWNIPLKVYQR